jgi:hypothetical protein
MTSTDLAIARDRQNTGRAALIEGHKPVAAIVAMWVFVLEWAMPDAWARASDVWDPLRVSCRRVRASSR